MKYLITYDLNRPGQDYEDLINAIKKYPSVHPMKSVWFIKTNKSANEIFNDIKNYIDSNDRLLICEINNNRQGWLNQEDWDFLNS